METSPSYIVMELALFYIYLLELNFFLHIYIKKYKKKLKSPDSGVL